MRLIEVLDKELIFLDIEARDKKDLIEEMTDLMHQSGVITDPQAFAREVLKRESQGSTAIGKGVAIPHARTKMLEKIVMALARLKKGVEFGAEDNEDVRLFFMLGTPLDMVGDYLKILARLSKLLKRDELRKKILKAKSTAEIMELIEEAECRLV